LGESLLNLKPCILAFGVNLCPSIPFNHWLSNCPAGLLVV
jgi:hypothetical protein